MGDLVTVPTLLGHATIHTAAPIPLTEGEGQQLIALVHALAARITRLVTAPTEIGAVSPLA